MAAEDPALYVASVNLVRKASPTSPKQAAASGSMTATARGPIQIYGLGRDSRRRIEEYLNGGSEASFLATIAELDDSNRPPIK
jgi:hypothetical protein